MHNPDPACDDQAVEAPSGPRDDDCPDDWTWEGRHRPWPPLRRPASINPAQRQRLRRAHVNGLARQLFWGAPQTTRCPRVYRRPFHRLRRSARRSVTVSSDEPDAPAATNCGIADLALPPLPQDSRLNRWCLRRNFWASEVHKNSGSFGQIPNPADAVLPGGAR